MFRIQGSIYGLLVGDALGVARPNRFNFTSQSAEQLMARHYADAGGMTLCTMSSITDCDKIDLEDMANLFNEWYIAGYMVSDESAIEGRIATSQALRKFGIGTPPDRCGCKEDCSDSALMRILPIALWCCNDPIAEIIKQAHVVTQFTNQNTEAEACSALFCLLMRGIILQKKGKATDILQEYYTQLKMTDHVEALKNILHGLRGVELRESFWNAWNAYAENQSNFEHVMKQVLANDTKSSTSGLAGALAGASVGLNDIPKRWLDQLVLPEEGSNVIDKFVKTILLKKKV